MAGDGNAGYRYDQTIRMFAAEPAFEGDASQTEVGGRTHEDTRLEPPRARCARDCAI